MIVCECFRTAQVYICKCLQMVIVLNRLLRQTFYYTHIYQIFMCQIQCTGKDSGISESTDCQGHLKYLVLTDT